MAVVALTASGIQSAAAVVLQQTLDANWRGAYEILVTSKSAATDVNGLLLPNSLGDAQHSLTLSDVTEIRSLDGVGVAAPIGEVIVPGFKLATTTMTLPASAAHAGQAPQAFRLTTTFTTNDGLANRVVSQQSQNIVIDESESTPGTGGAPGPGNGIWGIDGSGVQIPDQTTSSVLNFDLTGGAPSSTAHITLVDPVAEKELLGNAGSFLDPLVKLRPTSATTTSDLTDWASSTRNSYADAFTNAEKLQAGDATQPAAPVLVSAQAAAELTMRLTVESFGSAALNPSSNGFNSPYILPESQVQGKRGVLVGTSTSNVSSLLNPFAKQAATINWPGTTANNASFGSSGIMLLQAVGVSSPGKTSRSSSGTYVLKAQGFKDPVPNYSTWPSSAFALSTDGTKAGFESSYVGTQMLADNKAGVLAVPVGSFSAASAEGAQPALSYVPLGAYDPLASTTSTGQTLKPSVTGLGVVGTRTTAIASIYSAAAWGQTAPVNAIRVRVSGIDSWSAAARAKVVSVTQAIRGLGFNAVIVAGSSPTNVNVRVEDYAFGVSSIDQSQKVGTVGQIGQSWSELGAAARADTAISNASLLILGIAFGSAVLLLGAVQVVSIPRRRGSAAVLRELGWTRSQIRRWMSGEEVPGISIILVAAVTAVAISGATPVSVLISALGVVVVVLVSFLAVLYGAGATTRRTMRRTSRTRADQLVVRTRSVSRFGLRQSVVHLLASLSLVVATTVVAISAVALTQVFLAARVSAGSSLLAQLTTTQASLPQVSLGIVGLAAGVFLAVLARRLDLAGRSRQWDAMRAMGWTRRDLGWAQIAESLTVGIPATIVSVLVAAAFAVVVHASSLPLLVTISGIAAIVVSVGVLSTRRKASS